MSNTDLIFNVLKRLREYADSTGSSSDLAAVKKAENVAMTEICGVDLDPQNKNYDAVMAVVYPEHVREREK